MDGGGWSLDHRPCVWIRSLLMWLLPCPIPHACNHLAFYQCGGRQLTKLLDHFDLLFSRSRTSLSSLNWIDEAGKVYDSKNQLRFFASDAPLFFFSSPLSLLWLLLPGYGFFWPETSKSRTWSLIEVECLYKKYKGVVTNHGKARHNN